MELEALVNQYHDKLNENDLAIISYVLMYKTQCETLSIVDLAKLCHTSKSSILRLTQKLGFSGFSEFKYSLKKASKEKAPTLNLLDLQREDMEATLKLMQQTDVATIVQKMHQADRIIGYGTGWGQQNAVKELNRNFMGCGKSMLSIPAKTEFDLNMPIITKNDFVVIISLSGDAKDLEQNIQTLNLRGVPILSITTFKNNYLASLAPFNLYYQVSPMHQTERNEMVSFITLNLVCDALFREYASYLIESGEL